MEFEKFKTMHFPRDVYVGHGVLSNLPLIAERYLRHGSVVIVTGNFTYGLVGRQVEDILRNAGYTVKVIKIGAADESNLNLVWDYASREKAGMVIGVGGGTKIDVAKKVAYDLDIPLVSVPTSPSHDGIASPRASISRPNGIYSEEGSMPIAIVADTSIMVKAPYRYLKAGAADVISNLTAILDWKLAHRIKDEEYSSSAAAISEYAARELIEKAHMILENVEESVWLVTKQILASGTAMAIAGSSRPASGSEHLIAHALSQLDPGDSIHGEQCAIGSVVSMFLHGGDWRSMKQTYTTIGMSIRASDYGISKAVMIKALSIAHSMRPDRYTILGESDLSLGASERSLEITGII